MTKLTKTFSLSLVAAGLFSSVASAQSIAIINATIHTSTEQGVLEGASVVIDEGKIVAINPESINADTTVDAQGQIVTAGFIGTMNQLGLVEVGAVAGSLRVLVTAVMIKRVLISILVLLLTHAVA